MTTINPRAAELAEFSREWEAIWLDENLERRRARRDELIAWKGRICAEDERWLVAALKSQGFAGHSVWDLVNTRAPYPDLIEVLRVHSQMSYLPPIREGIFRALTVKESGSAEFLTLVEQWKKGIGKDNKFLRWALAHAISYIAKRKQIAVLSSLIAGDDYSDDPFIRRLKRSEEGRELLAHRKMELAK